VGQEDGSGFGFVLGFPKEAGSYSYIQPMVHEGI